MHDPYAALRVPTAGTLLSAVVLLVLTEAALIGKGRVWPIYAVIFLSGIVPRAFSTKSSVR